MNKAEKINTACYIFALLCFLFSLAYVPTRAMLDPAFEQRAEYRIMIFQALMGLLFINLPAILTRVVGFCIPKLFSALFILFLWGSIFLGEVMSFYYRFPFFDDLLHLVSSVMLGLFGFSFADILSGQSLAAAPSVRSFDLDTSRGDVNSRATGLSPLARAVFAAFFAIGVGALWEVYEFTFDGVLGLNMQKYATEGVTVGEAKLIELVGRAALADTMTDLIIDCVGAGLTAAVGYASYKRGFPLFEPFRVTVRPKRLYK